MRLFLGKFSNKFPEQIEKKYYAAGDKGNSWYGEVEQGDYVYIAHEGKIIALWKAREYTRMKTAGNQKDVGVLQFDEIKTYDDVSLMNDFARYKYFKHDLNLVNKVVKSVKGLGFIPVKTYDGCPEPVDIDFKSGAINIYIGLEDADLAYKEGDIRVTVNDIDEMRISGIHRYQKGGFVVYEELNDLYEKRNEKDGLYTIRELYEYSLVDQAAKKRKFLVALIDELEKNGFMKVSNPIRLYDNLLVGRKRSATVKVKDTESTDETEEEVIEEFDDQYQEFAALLNFNPNLILYGPPGTGKTFATQKIIDCFENKYFKTGKNYSAVEAENRVKNITFHQSYSYEEFIEGIRPILNDGESENVGYKLENGLFKELCINAEKEMIKRRDNAKYVDMIHSESNIWKVSLGERKSDDVFNECIKTGDIAIGWLKDDDLSNMDYDGFLEKLEDSSTFGNKPTQNANSINSFVNDMTVGDIVLIYDGQQTIRMIGVINSDYRYDLNYDYRHRRSIEWFKDLQYPINVHKYNGFKNLTMKTVYQLNRISVSDIIEMVTQNSLVKQSSDDKREIRPYYMIIDEINRGNIAKIFGELITLIEQDKRGSVKSLLPYSKKEFSVPSNLYIIGTMNTADRSIAAIDTALRRRFTFVEIEPDSAVLTKHDNPIINDTVNLTKLLDVINEKITDRYDRDHRIGHAYFMGIETLNNLYQTWYYKVLPLLGEYFYNDVDNLVSIVGKGFYDQYGNIKYLSLNSKYGDLSEFEEKIIEIYR
jgi:5-methylcytosine-specific restriction protein B